MSFLRWLFPRPNKIKLGTLWAYQEDWSNPFRKISYRPVEMKKGWVRYEVIDRNGKVLYDSHTEARAFWAFYKEIEDE